MFTPRELPPAVEAVRAEHAPDAIVLDCDRDFETLPPGRAEELAPFVEGLEPASYPDNWLPEDAPELLVRYASGAFVVGLPGDGSVAWTRQTAPPTIIVKARVEGTPEPFLHFLLAEAVVEVGLEIPESFLGFFGEEYRALDRATPLDPAGTYQLAAALYDGWRGLRTRPTFAGWADGGHPDLGEAWADAGRRLEERVADLPGAVARGETEFAEATELACGAIKHGLDLPAPFAALDTGAYREHGAPYAVRWAQKTFDALE